MSRKDNDEGMVIDVPSSLSDSDSNSFLSGTSSEKGGSGGFINSEDIKERESQAQLNRTDSLLIHHNQILTWEQTEDQASSTSSSVNNTTPRTMRMKTGPTMDSMKLNENNSPINNISSNFTFDDGTPEQKESIGIDCRPLSSPKTCLYPDIVPREFMRERATIHVSAASLIRRDVVPTTTTAKKIIFPDSHHKYINRYLLLEKLGQGSFGTVRKCKDITTGKVFAMKILNKINLRSKLRFTKKRDNSIKRSNALDDVQEEIAIMKSVRHPNVVNLVEVIDSADTLYLILEYMPFGSIAKSSAFINKIEREDSDHKEHDREVLRLYMRDIVSGLAYLHSQRICHSDIKPENVLIGKDGVLKLGDFGLSKYLIQGQSRRVFDQKDGTPAFQAPECLKASLDEKFSLFPTDIWALGVTLYQLKYGYLPFFSKDERQLVEKILCDPLIIPETEDKSFANILRSMLEKDPAKRITVKELCRHTWITDKGRLHPLTQSYDRYLISENEHQHAFAELVDLQSSPSEKKSVTRARRQTTANDNSRRTAFPKHDPALTISSGVESSSDEDEDYGPSVSVPPSIYRRVLSEPAKAIKHLKPRRLLSPLERKEDKLRKFPLRNKDRLDEETRASYKDLPNFSELSVVPKQPSQAKVSFALDTKGLAPR